MDDKLKAIIDRGLDEALERDKQNAAAIARIAAVNHADALAEALRLALDMLQGFFENVWAGLEPEDVSATADTIDEARAVLAAYDAAKEAQP